MPINPRVRANNVFGITVDNPLSSVAAAFNSAGLVNLPAIASQHAVVVLDPLRVNGAPEIVIVTAHTALGAVATITRGAYGTTARSHPQGTMWMHTPVDEDYIEVLTSATRPTDPYEGQFIFETDTNKLVGYGGVDWAPRDAGGQLGYAETTAIQAGIGPGPTLLTGLSVAPTISANRRIKITAHGQLQMSNATSGYYASFRMDGIDVGRAWIADNFSGRLMMDGSNVSTPSAGVHTFTIAIARYLGAGTVTFDVGAANQGFILVEDIGAA